VSVIESAEVELVLRDRAENVARRARQALARVDPDEPIEVEIIEDHRGKVARVINRDWKGRFLEFGTVRARPDHTFGRRSSAEGLPPAPAMGVKRCLTCASSPTSRRSSSRTCCSPTGRSPVVGDKVSSPTSRARSRPRSASALPRRRLELDTGHEHVEGLPPAIRLYGSTRSRPTTSPEGPRRPPPGAGARVRRHGRHEGRPLLGPVWTPDPDQATSRATCST
jgi:hypothetical protein